MRNDFAAMGGGSPGDEGGDDRSTSWTDDPRVIGYSAQWSLTDPKTVRNWSPPPPPPNGPYRRVGWSLVISAVAVMAVAEMAMRSNAPMIGLVACGGMALCGLGLVAAEVISRYW